MKSDNKTAKIVGILFIIGTVSGSIGVGISEPILGATDYLTKIAENETLVTVGALLELVMGAAVAAIPYVAFPVLRKYNERIAIGYIGARTMEGIGYIISVIILLSVTSLSREFVKTEAANTANLQALGSLLLAAREWANFVGVFIVFNLGALLFYYLLYVSKLVPRFISIWGLIAAVMWLSGVLLIIFDLTTASSTIYTISYIPMFAQEMVMAVWLIAKGFNSSTLPVGSEKLNK